MFRDLSPWLHCFAYWYLDWLILRRHHRCCFETMRRPPYPSFVFKHASLHHFAPCWSRDWRSPRKHRQGSNEKWRRHLSCWASSPVLVLAHHFLHFHSQVLCWTAKPNLSLSFSHHPKQSRHRLHLHWIFWFWAHPAPWLTLHSFNWSHFEILQC